MKYSYHPKITKRKCIFACVGTIIILLSHMYKSKKQLMNICKALKISEERFRIAASHTDNIVFDYDLKKKKMYHCDPNVLRYGVNIVIENVPESLVKNGIISAAYAKEFCQIFYDIAAGAPKASCVVKSNLCDNTHRWDKITLTNVFDELGKPIRTIGIISNVTEQKEAEIRFVQEEQYRKAIRAKSILNYEFYLTKDQIINGNDCWNQCLKKAKTNRYSCALEYVLNHNVYSEDRSNVYETFCLSNLLKIYSQGQSNVELEYRRIKEDGTVVWVNCAMHLFRDLKNNEIKGFAYVKDIDEEKKEALHLKDKARRDSLTGLYNRAETERLVGEILASTKRKDVVHAFLIIDLDDFKGTNDQYGHIAGDAALNEIATKMQTIFRKTDVLGRLGGDEFVALLRDIGDFKEIEDKVRSLCNLQIDLGESQGGILEIFSTIGVAMAFEQGSDFMELYEKADKALYFAKNQGKARYACYDETLFLYESKC
ncbi:sensor domain-containing diguanylate cyclase [Anaerovorax sp. IOR16]|uniref:sensor domain-containing diguanylate cyclase n=1 Tax=Anaerovorax sp. IOR16 TaxID=2773458 RepID=UPI0019D12C3B|nr:GGDEF domain-containing protein [Anaerovorax sp. IOR16]